MRQTAYWSNTGIGSLLDIGSHLTAVTVVRRAAPSTGQRRACCVMVRSRWNVCPAPWTAMLSADSSESATSPGLVDSHCALQSSSLYRGLTDSVPLNVRVVWCLSLRKATWWFVSSSTWAGRDIERFPPPNAPSSNWSCRSTSGSARERRVREEPSCTACEYTPKTHSLVHFVYLPPPLKQECVRISSSVKNLVKNIS